MLYKRNLDSPPPPPDHLSPGSISEAHGLCYWKTSTDNLYLIAKIIYRVYFNHVFLLIQRGWLQTQFKFSCCFWHQYTLFASSFLKFYPSVKRRRTRKHLEKQAMQLIWPVPGPRPLAAVHVRWPGLQAMCHFLPPLQVPGHLAGMPLKAAFQNVAER